MQHPSRRVELRALKTDKFASAYARIVENADNQPPKALPVQFHLQFPHRLSVGLFGICLSEKVKDGISAVWACLFEVAVNRVFAIELREAFRHLWPADHAHWVRCQQVLLHQELGKTAQYTQVQPHRPCTQPPLLKQVHLIAPQHLRSHPPQHHPVLSRNLHSVLSRNLQ